MPCSVWALQHEPWLRAWDFFSLCLSRFSLPGGEWYERGGTEGPFAGCHANKQTDLGFCSRLLPGWYSRCVHGGSCPKWLPTISDTWVTPPSNYISRWTVRVGGCVFALANIMIYWWVPLLPRSSDVPFFWRRLLAALPSSTQMWTRHTPFPLPLSVLSPLHRICGFHLIYLSAVFSLLATSPGLNLRNTVGGFHFVFSLLMQTCAPPH